MVQYVVPQPTEGQRIGNQIDAAMIFAQAHFVSVVVSWYHRNGQRLALAIGWMWISLSLLMRQKDGFAVTVLRDRIFVSVQVELNQFSPSRRRDGRSLSTQIGTGLVRRVLTCIKIILRKSWLFIEGERKMKRVHIKLLIYMQAWLTLAE